MGSGGNDGDRDREVPIEQARKQFSSLVNAAANSGTVTVITKQGARVAQIGPVTVPDEPALARACRSCGAQPGEGCHDGHGNPTSYFHSGRW